MASKTVKELVTFCRNRGKKTQILIVWDRQDTWKNLASLTIDGKSYKGIGYRDVDMAIKEAMNRVRNGEEN